MKIIGLLTALVLAQLAFGQKYYEKFKMVEVPKGKSISWQTVGMDQEGNVFTYGPSGSFSGLKLKKHWMKVISNAGAIVAEVKIGKNKELKARGLEYRDIFFLGDSPILLCLKNTKKNAVFAVRIDVNGKIKGKEVEVGSKAESMGRGCYSYYKLFPTKNGNYCLLTEIECKGADKVNYRAVQLDDELKVLSDTKFEINEERLDNISITFTENNLFFACTHEEREKVKGKILKQDIDYMHLYRVNLEEEDVSEVELNDRLSGFKTGYFSLGVSGQDLILSGQLFEKGGFAGLFSGKLDENTLEISGIKTHKFSDEFVTQFWSEKQKEKDDKKRKRKDEDDEDRNFGNAFKFVETFAAEGGGTYTTYQKYWMYERTVTTTDSKGNTTTRTVYYFNYGDILLTKSNAAGEIEFTRLIPSLQVTQNYNPGIGYRVIQDEKGLHFLHMKRNDDREYDLFITQVDPDGEYKSTYIMNPREEKIIVSSDKVFVDLKRKQFVVATHVLRLKDMKKSILLIVSV